MKVSYPAIIHAEDGCYWAEFPDVAGCFSDGDSITEVIENASDALGGVLCAMMDQGQPLPQPSSMESLKPSDGFTSMILTDPLCFKKDTRAVKKTLTIPAWLNQEAEKRSINFSAVLQKALINLIQ